MALLERRTPKFTWVTGEASFLLDLVQLGRRGRKSGWEEGSVVLKVLKIIMNQR